MRWCDFTPASGILLRLSPLAFSGVSWAPPCRPPSIQPAAPRPLSNPASTPPGVALLLRVAAFLREDRRPADGVCSGNQRPPALDGISSGASKYSVPTPHGELGAAEVGACLSAITRSLDELRTEVAALRSPPQSSGASPGAAAARGAAPSPSPSPGRGELLVGVAMGGMGGARGGEAAAGRGEGTAITSTDWSRLSADRGSLTIAESPA